MITRRRSRLLSANSGASKNHNNINNVNNNNTSTKVDNTTPKEPEFKINKESVMRCLPEMLPDTDAQNITIPTDLFEDFENLKSATKLDSATLMRKLLTDFNKLKESVASASGNKNLKVNECQTPDVSMLLKSIKQECPSPEIEHRSPSPYRIPETTMTPIAELNVNEDLDISSNKSPTSFQDQDSNRNFLNGKVPSPVSQTEDEENRDRSKNAVYRDNNNDSRIEHTSTNSPYQFQEYQQHHQSPYKLPVNYQHHYLEPQEPKSAPLVCKTEDLSSYNDGYGVDITHGSKLFKSRLKEELERKDQGSNPDTVLRYGDNQLGQIGTATDNSDDTETYEIPNSVSRDFQSPGPVNHGERLTTKKMETDGHYLNDMKSTRYGLLKEGGYSKKEAGNRGNSPDNEIPLDLSIVKIESNSSYSSASLSTHSAPSPQASLPVPRNPPFVSPSSPDHPKDYSNIYSHFESPLTKRLKREPQANDYPPEDEKENFHSFTQDTRSAPDADPSTSLTFESVSTIEPPDIKPNITDGRRSASSSPEIISSKPATPRNVEVPGSANKLLENQHMLVNMQQAPTMEILTSFGQQPQQETTKVGDLQQIVVPQMNQSFLGPGGQNMTAKFFPLSTTGNSSMSMPTNVVTLQKNDQCMYVYPMSFPTLSSMPPGTQQIGVPQQMMPLQKLEPVPSFVPEKVPEKDQLKLVAESNIFPGVYTSILKLSSHKRSRSKQDKVKNNPVINQAQSMTLPPPPQPQQNATPVSLSTQMPNQPMTSQAVMFIPTMQPLQNMCVPTSAVGQSIQPQNNFTMTGTPATANLTNNYNISVPSKQTVTMTSAGASNTHTSSSSNQQSIIMVYPHTALSAMGKPVRRRGRPPKLPMLTQLLVDKRPKLANVPIAESKLEPLRILDQKDAPLISHLPFQERMNVSRSEPIPIDANGLGDDKMDGVEIVGETPATVTNQGDRTRKSPVSTNLAVPTTSATGGGPLYQEMILSPRSLKNIKPRKPHSANDFMKPNANFICTSFRIRPRAFRSRRNGAGRNRKNAKGSAMPNQSPMMSNESPEMQQKITRQQLQMHQQQLQQQLQQQIQAQNQQEQQRQEEKARKQEQLHHQKLLEQQQQQLQQQIQQQQQQLQQQQQNLQRQQQQQQEQQQQQQQQQQRLQHIKQEPESQDDPYHEKSGETEVYSLPSSPPDHLKGSISPLRSSVSSTAIRHRLENDKSWTSDDNSRGSSPRNFFQELYHCKICNEIVSSEEKATHQKQHVPIRFFCQTCGLEYQSFLARNSADKTEPIDDIVIPEDNNGETVELSEPLQCDRCCDNFSHPKFALNRCLQVNGVHILCDLCGDQFRTFTNYYEHRNKVHGDCGLTRAEQYVCDTCGKMLYTSKALRLHRKLHLDRTVQCTINDCPRFFHNNMDLLRHIREQHDKTKEFSCIYDGCNKKFMKNFHLQEHIRVKHFNIRAFHCSWPGCTKEFAAERHLKVHLLIHKDEKPLKCEFCDYRCRQRNALNWHMRKHPEAPYKYRKFSINSSDC